MWEAVYVLWDLGAWLGDSERSRAWAKLVARGLLWAGGGWLVRIWPEAGEASAGLARAWPETEHRPRSLGKGQEEDQGVQAP